MTTYRAEVYRCPEWKVWGCAKYDSDFNLIGDTDWHHLKSQARRVADEMLESGEVSEIHIFSASGEHKQTIKQ